MGLVPWGAFFPPWSIKIDRGWRQLFGIYFNIETYYTQTINMVKKKQLRRKLAPMTHSLNPYAHMLLDPEHGPVMGVPDEYPYKTHKCRIVMNRPAQFDASGNAFATVGKSLKEFFGQRSAADQTGRRFWTISDTFPNDVWTPEREWHDNDRFNASSTSDVTTFPAHFISDDNRELETTFNAYTGEAPGSGGVLLQGFPAIAGDVIAITGYTSDTTANAWKVQARYNVNGTATTVESASLTGGGANFSATITAPAEASLLIDYGFVRQTGSGFVTKVAAVVTQDSTVDVDYESLGKEDGTEYATLRSLGSRARIVAMSLWAQYAGSLTSNGRIATGQISHQDLSVLPSTDIGTLSSLPGFYSDSLLKPDEAGSYAWFRPMSVEDIKFDDLDDPDAVGSRLMCAIKANDADAQNVIFRACAIVEIQTTNQVATPTSNIVNPPMIWEAQRELRDFPSGMGNTNHLKAIANKLKSFATHAAKKVAQLGPYAMTLVKLLKDQGAEIPQAVEFGLEKAVQYAPQVESAAASFL